jgi:hypothetical protein
MSSLIAMLFLCAVNILSKPPRVSAFRLQPRLVSSFATSKRPFQSHPDILARRKTSYQYGIGGIFPRGSVLLQIDGRKYFSSATGATDEPSSSALTTEPAASNALKKVKVALVLGYVGKGYHGLQLSSTANPAVRTIEHDLEEALYKIGCISESNHKFLGKIGWSRSSRTDKGVHAARIIIGAKLLVDKSMITADNRLPHLIPRLNAQLPEGIRVFSACRVNAGFNARKACKWRYVYISY